MPRVTLHPLEADVAAHQSLVQGLQQILVEHGLAVGLFPALPFPAGHPLGDGIDDVLAVAQDLQRLVRQMCGRAQQIEHRVQLALVVRAFRPAPGVPVIVVDVPRPARRTGVRQGRTVCGCDDHERQASA
ncbi:hypothetical protein SDC9_106387 [bioreactor metagenome]|uniref:Uncharacterized protein n=1 Tax=bioreactor metagenome TaxID=1076179 RepID=A0A645B8T0_9ZZZZ